MAADFRRKSQKELLFIDGCIKHGLLQQLLPSTCFPLRVGGAQLFSPEKFQPLQGETADLAIAFFKEKSDLWSVGFAAKFLKAGDWNILTDEQLEKVLRNQTAGRFGFWREKGLKELAIESESPRLMENLVRAGIEIERSHWNKPELWKCGNAAAVDYFISQGDNPNDGTRYRLPPIWHSKNVEVARAFIAHGARYDEKLEFDLAHEYPKVEALEALLAIDPSARNIFQLSGYAKPFRGSHCNGQVCLKSFID